MGKPSVLQRVARWLNPRYLCSGEIAKVHGVIHTFIIKRDMGPQDSWRIAQSVKLLPGSTIKYMGIANKIGIHGDMGNNDSLFELEQPNVEVDVINPTTIARGDAIFVSPTDRKYVWPIS